MAEPDLGTHASWLNQVEIFFSTLQRKVLTPNDYYENLAVLGAIATPALSPSGERRR